MDKPVASSIEQFFKRFPDEESARIYLEAKRWGGRPVCANCGSMNVVACKDRKPLPYRCRDCRKHFTVRAGTVLAELTIPLRKWLMAVYMLTTAQQGLPVAEMARAIGITEELAKQLAHHIRTSWLAAAAAAAERGSGADEI
jgi:transposase-like protein